MFIRRCFALACVLVGGSSLLPLGCGQSRSDERLQSLKQADIITDPGPPSEDQWFPIGPAPIAGGLIASPTVGGGIGGVVGSTETTGRAASIANNPARPLQFWVGMAGGGLWQSELALDSSNALTTLPFNLMLGEWPAIGAIALDPDSCDATRCSDLFVGTGEGKLRRQTLYGVGIYEGVFSSSGGEFPSEGYTFTKVPGSDAFTGGAVNDIIIDKSNGTKRLFATVMPGNTASPHAATVMHAPPPSGYGVFRFDPNATTWIREDVPFGAPPNRFLPGELVKIGASLFAGISSRGLYKRALVGTNATWCPLNPGVEVPPGCTAPVADCSAAPAGTPCGLPAPGPDSKPIFDRPTIAAAPSNPNVIYATFSDCSRTFTSIAADPAGCAAVLFHTTDGVKWSNANATAVGQSGSRTLVGGSQMEGYSWYSGELAVSPTDPNEVYYGGVGLWKSTDAGAHFAPLSNNLHPDHTQILSAGFSLNGSAAFFETNDGGFSLFSAGGNTGTLNRFPGTQFYSGATHEIVPCVDKPGSDDDCDGTSSDDGTECAAGNTSTCNTQNVIAGAQDNGILLYNGGRSWFTLKSGDGGDTILRNSRESFNTIQLIDPVACTLSGKACSDSPSIKAGLALHWQEDQLNGDAALFEPPFIEHAATHTLFFATDKVYSRAPTATTFTVIGGSTPLGGTLGTCTGATGTNPAGNCTRGVCVNGNCRQFFGDVEQPLAISALAAARTDVNRVYAGLYDGSVFALNAGAWTQILAPGRTCDLPTFDRPNMPGSLQSGTQLRCTPVSSLEVDPQNANVLYATIGGFGVPGKHIRRWDGSAWTDFSDGELANSDLPAHVLRINAAVPTEMYVGTEDGVYKRKNDGKGWVRGFQFPHVPVYGLTVDGSRGRTYAMTHGRGAYLQVKKPTLRVFEGWMASKSCPGNKPCIWDILVYGEGFQPSTTGPCHLDILTPSGTVCATGTFDGYSQNTIGVDGDSAGSGFGLLTTQNQLVSPDAENRAVIAACFNGNCVSNTKGTPTPIASCLPDASNPTRTIAAVQVTCPNNPPVITSVGANCPALTNPPSSDWNPAQFNDTPPGGAAAQAGIAPSAPAAPPGGAAAAAAPSTTITLSAILVADPPTQLCSVSIPYTPSEPRVDTLRRARDAFNSNADCIAKNVTAVLPDADTGEHEDPVDEGNALHLLAKNAVGMSLHFAVQVAPGSAGMCQTVSHFPGYMRSQLDITDLALTTLASGAQGGKLTFQEVSPLGNCSISVQTQPGDSGEAIANRVLTEYLSAAANPKHATCPLFANPRDLIIKGGNLITIAGTGMSVCWTDPGVGIALKPDGVDLLDVPLSQLGILGTDGVEIRDRAQVRQGTGYGVVAAAGIPGVTLFPDVGAGNVFSVGTVTLRDRAHVFGNVKTGQTLVRQNQTVVDGTIFEHSVVRLPSISGFATEFPTMTGSSFDVQPGNQLTLAPGTYNAVTMHSNTTLNLSAGTYFVRALDLEPQTTLKLNEAAGPVLIYLRDSLIFRGTQQTVSGSHPAGFVSYLGTGSIFIESPYRGTLAAPNGTLVLRATTSPHIGAFFGRLVQVVDSGAQINVVPFTLPIAGADAPASTCSDGLRNGSETGVDCGGSCGPNCQLGQACNVGNDCTSGVCTSNVCQASTSCTEASAIDLGDQGHDVTVLDSGCVRVRDHYPTWWGTRAMRLETSAPSAGFPIPFTWSNACTHSGGSGIFNGVWQSQVLGSTSSACATLIDLTGSAPASVSLRYWAN